MEQYWQQLAGRYGRDLSWLHSAMALYRCGIVQTSTAARISFLPTEQADLGMQYGLAPGLTLHFLLEAADAQEPDAETQLPQPFSRCDRLCIPVKTGRVGLGWQLGARLDAIRPLALLRPFYLFCPTVCAPSGGEVRRCALADARRLGRMLDNGWVGIDRCALSQEVVLQKRCLPADQT